MKYGKPQKDVRPRVERQKRLSCDGLIVAHGQVVIGDFRERWWDEVARHNLRASIRITNEAGMRMGRFVPLKYLLHNQTS